jgi:hypothetical protein
MKWEVEFYHERRRALARYDVEAATPAEATRLARALLVAAHPATKSSRWPSLYERAQRTGGRDADGWVLHRMLGHQKIATGGTS